MGVRTLRFERDHLDEKKKTRAFLMRARNETKWSDRWNSDGSPILC